jgi:erythritol kinase
MGPLPSELRLTGGAARSPSLRAVLAGAVQAPVRVSGREEAGAAGAAMMAAVAVCAYPSMEDCIARWVTPLLGPAEAPDPALVGLYDRLFPAYVAARGALEPVWEALAARGGTRTPDTGSPEATLASERSTA